MNILVLVRPSITRPKLSRQVAGAVKVQGNKYNSWNGRN